MSEYLTHSGHDRPSWKELWVSLTYTKLN